MEITADVAAGEERGEIAPFGRAHLVFAEQREQRRVRERLRAVQGDRARRRLAVGAGSRAHGLLAVDDERRRELVRQRSCPQPADHELARLDRRRVRKQVENAHDFDATTRYTCSTVQELLA